MANLNLAKAARRLGAPPQTEQARSDQSPNDAGGWGWTVDKWRSLRRFLILGSEKGTYYVDEPTLTRQSAESVIACLGEDGARTVNEIIAISESGRAARNSPALFALALACVPDYTSPETRALAFAGLPRVCRTGTHLFEFCEYANSMRGWGRGLRRAVANWYLSKSEQDLELQLVKYRQRAIGGHSWTHKDVLALAHPKTRDEKINNLLAWAVNGYWDKPDEQGAFTKDYVPPLIGGYEAAQTHPDQPQPGLVAGLGLPREALPTQWLNDHNVWRALLQSERGYTMPITAMLRNLGKMTAVGLIAPFESAQELIAAKLTNVKALKSGRLHPFAILLALKTYASGKGDKGHLSWQPNTRIIDALNDAFYKAFEAVDPVGGKYIVALDVSGSMADSTVHGSNISAAEASAALALAFLNIEPQTMTLTYNDRAGVFPISKKQRIDDVARLMAGYIGGSTNCAAPIQLAIDQKIVADGFVIYTDSQTWSGMVHPFKAIKKYRELLNPNARCVVVQMCNNDTSIIAPDDPLSFECVGLDSNTPMLIRDFLAGEF